MTFDLASTLAKHAGRNSELHAAHVNPRFATVLRTIGYDKTYTRAEGAHLWDEQGNKYLDFLGGYAVCNFGRNHPTIKKALADYLALDLPTMVQFEAPLLSGLLAEELKRRVGRGLDFVFFTNSGTEGVEAAIKFAKCATGRPALLHAPKAFHGLSSGSVSLNGCESFREGFAPFLPECRMVAFDDLAALERELARGDVAAFVIEPIQGKGVNIHSPGYLAAAARLCHKYGALFVAEYSSCMLRRIDCAPLSASASPSFGAAASPSPPPSASATPSPSPSAAPSASLAGGGCSVATVAGIAASPGTLDGPLGVSNLNTPSGLAQGPGGALLFTERGGCRVRRAARCFCFRWC